MVKIFWYSKNKNIQIPTRIIENQFNRIIRRKEKITVNIIVTTPQYIKKINNIYRQKNSATDVLSFRYDNERGEIYICKELARQQARKNKVAFRQEIKRLVIHGLLHVVGYHHEAGGNKAKKMFFLQEKILKYVG